MVACMIDNGASDPLRLHPMAVTIVAIATPARSGKDTDM